LFNDGLRYVAACNSASHGCSEFNFVFSRMVSSESSFVLNCAVVRPIFVEAPLSTDQKAACHSQGSVHPRGIRAVFKTIVSVGKFDQSHLSSHYCFNDFKALLRV